MDWGLTTVILAAAFLVGHLAMDFRSLARNLGRAQGHYNHDSEWCDQRHAMTRGSRELRHEAVWAAAAIAVLTGHIILDFVT